MSDLITNLQTLTNNLNDLNFTRYGVITQANGLTCTVIEKESEIEHTEVPVQNGLQIVKGDNVIISFVENNLYNPYISGVIGRRVSSDVGNYVIEHTVYFVNAEYNNHKVTVNNDTGRLEL